MIEVLVTEDLFCRVPRVLELLLTFAIAAMGADDDESHPAAILFGQYETVLDTNAGSVVPNQLLQNVVATKYRGISSLPV